jgi:phospholipid/cholesterol/gamma-HCH transport system substrate-binding protein
MARQLAWSNVRGGLIAIAVIVGVSMATLRYARVGALRGDTIRVYALVGEARGVLKGSEVWLLGQKVGKVTDIEFRTPTVSDTSGRLVLSMEVLDRYRVAMHRDAEAQVRPGGSVIGAVVVYLSSGTASAPLIRDRDTIRARPQADVDAATAQFGAAARELPAIAGNLKTLRAELQSTRGSMGALINAGAAERGPLQSTGAQMMRLRQRLTGDRGSLGRMMSESEGIGVRAKRVMARADSVRALVGSSVTSLGRFRRDSTLLAEVTDIRNELAKVRGSLAESRGTAGRVLHDSAAFSALGDAHREMSLLVADLKKHPLRYSPF